MPLIKLGKKKAKKADSKAGVAAECDDARIDGTPESGASWTPDSGASSTPTKPIVTAGDAHMNGSASAGDLSATDPTPIQTINLTPTPSTTPSTDPTTTPTDPAHTLTPTSTPTPTPTPTSSPTTPTQTSTPGTTPTSTPHPTQTPSANSLLQNSPAGISPTGVPTESLPGSGRVDTPIPPSSLQDLEIQNLPSTPSPSIESNSPVLTSPSEKPGSVARKTGCVTKYYQTGSPANLSEPVLVPPPGTKPQTRIKPKRETSTPTGKSPSPGSRPPKGNKPCSLKKSSPKPSAAAQYTNKSCLVDTPISSSLSDTGSLPSKVNSPVETGSPVPRQIVCWDGIAPKPSGNGRVAKYFQTGSPSNSSAPVIIPPPGTKTGTALPPGPSPLSETGTSPPTGTSTSSPGSTQSQSGVQVSPVILQNESDLGQVETPKPTAGSQTSSSPDSILPSGGGDSRSQMPSTGKGELTPTPTGKTSITSIGSKSKTPNGSISKGLSHMMGIEASGSAASGRVTSEGAAESVTTDGGQATPTSSKTPTGSISKGLGVMMGIKASESAAGSVTSSATPGSVTTDGRQYENSTIPATESFSAIGTPMQSSSPSQASKTPNTGSPISDNVSSHNSIETTGKGIKKEPTPIRATTTTTPGLGPGTTTPTSSPGPGPEPATGGIMQRFTTAADPGTFMRKFTPKSLVPGAPSVNQELVQMTTLVAAPAAAPAAKEATPPPNMVQLLSMDRKSEERDVYLRIHLRLKNQQDDNLKVKLNVKVDPEVNQFEVSSSEREIPQWTPCQSKLGSSREAGSSSHLASSSTLMSSSQISGYHSEATDTTDFDNYNTEDGRALGGGLSPIDENDKRLAGFKQMLIKQTDQYVSLKRRLMQFVVTKILKLPFRSQIFSFIQTCQFLRDYLQKCRVRIVTVGELVMFEPGVAGAPFPIEPPVKRKKLPRKYKKHTERGMQYFAELQQAYVSYRTLYYMAVDYYAVKMVESSFGFFMSELQEEVIMCSMVMSGQISPIRN